MFADISHPVVGEDLIPPQISLKSWPPVETLLGAFGACISKQNIVIHDRSYVTKIKTTIDYFYLLLNLSLRNFSPS